MPGEFRPIGQRTPLGGAGEDAPRRSGGTALFLIGTLGGLAAVGLFEWKWGGGGPQPAVAQVEAKPAAAEPRSTPQPVRTPAATRGARGGVAQVQARPTGAASSPTAAGIPATPLRSSPTAAPPVQTTANPRSPRGDDVQRTTPRNAAPAVSTSDRPISSAAGFVSPTDMTITRILVGEDALRAGVIDESSVREHAREDRYLVYFGISVSHTGGGGRRATYDDFRLEDASGLIYAPLRTRDALGVTGSGTAAGGVAFAVYNDSAPARLLVRVSGERFVPLPDSIFRRAGR